MLTLTSCNSVNYSSSEAPMTSGTSSSESEINGFVRADYDTYNSTAEENGLAYSKVFIDAKIGGVIKINDQVLGSFITKEGDDDQIWTGVFGTSDDYDKDELYNKYLFKNVRMFGLYLGYSEITQNPTILIGEIQYEDKTDTFNDIDTMKNNVQSTTSISENSTESTTNSIDSLTKLYSDENVDVFFKSFKTKYFTDEYVVFEVENNTNDELTFQCSTISLDGISYNKIIMSEPVAPKSRGEIEAKIDSKLSTDFPLSIGVTMTYSNNDISIYKQFTTSETIIR